MRVIEGLEENVILCQRHWSGDVMMAAALTEHWGGQINRTEGCLEKVDVPGNQINCLQQGCFNQKRRDLFVHPGISLYFLTAGLLHLLPVFCSQVATAEASQESSYPINRHNEGPQQHDCLRMERRAVSIHPGFINKLPDVLKNKTRFVWIMDIRSLHICLLYFRSNLWFSY